MRPASDPISTCIEAPDCYGDYRSSIPPNYKLGGREMRRCAQVVRFSHSLDPLLTSRLGIIHEVL